MVVPVLEMLSSIWDSSVCQWKGKLLSKTMRWTQISSYHERFFWNWQWVMQSPLSVSLSNPCGESFYKEYCGRRRDMGHMAKVLFVKWNYFEFPCPPNIRSCFLTNILYCFLKNKTKYFGTLSFNYFHFFLKIVLKK